ncbi:t-SNARE [Polychaeton citri CBS 116435]|uniref:t-SNARE n=1 Tax=Polychaeton citri CBS 116435 TaxID=1314669 RepID=A0A9P4UPQ2_9PEZI|nr:t-SNARE [Polychaeton citri CBS 116435]
MAYNNNYNAYGNQNPAYGAGNPYSNPPPSYGQANEMEMQSLTANQAPQPSNSPGPDSDPNRILNDCRAVSRAIDDLESRLEELKRQHRQFISGNGVNNRAIDNLSADIMSGYRGLGDRVRRIKGLRGAQEPRNRSQVEAIDRRIRKAINTYQQVESSFRKEVQEQQRRQYLIVKPDATEQEILEATESGADTQIFQQALLNSDRRGQAQSTLANVRQRHDAIQQIEKTMLELSQLFQDLDQMIIEQEPIVENIESKAQETHMNLEMGNVEVEKAIGSARGARKKKWICLGVSILVLIIVVIIIIFATRPLWANKGGNGGNGGN